MSAVMSTLSMISGGRRGHRKLTSRKSGQFSDAGEDRTRSHHDLSKQQRSASLQTLEPAGGGVVNLETLEAKMASIEVSLAGSRRRSAGPRDASRELDALRTALTDKDTLIQNLKKQLSASLSAARLAVQASGGGCGGAGGEASVECAPLSAEERRALEERAAAVRHDLDARRNNILDLRRRLDKTHVTDNIDSRIQQAELQYKLGREELELLTLGEQARALAQLIDQASQHQHSLYSAVSECGGSGVLVCCEPREGSWGAAARGPGLAVDWADHAALRPGDRVVELNGTLVISCRSPEEAARAAAAGPARLVVLRPHRPEPAAAVTQNEACSLRAELGALRVAADDAEKAKEGLRCDNTRLTHRISYLEEQVAELLTRHNQLQPVSSNESCITVNKSRQNVTNINISTEPAGRAGGAGGKSEVQVFQKGPDITALVAKLPGLDAAEANLPLMRPRSNASGASSRAAASPRGSPAPAPLRSHSSHSLEPRATRMRHSLSHHCIHAANDYHAETDAAIRMIERNQRHMEKQRLNTERLARARDDYYELDLKAAYSAPDAGHLNKSADRIEESIKKTNWAERKTLSIIEQLKRSQRLRKMKKNESVEEVHLAAELAAHRRIDGKPLESAHKSSRRSSKSHSRSAKSSELESECSDFPGAEGARDYGSETCSRLAHYRKHDERPAPPRKPLRLSLHRARSAHSLAGEEARSEPEAGKRPVKRTHAAERAARNTPRPPRRAPPPAPDDLYPDMRDARWC